MNTSALGKLLILIVAAIGIWYIAGSLLRYPYVVSLPGLYVSVTCQTLLIPVLLVGVIYFMRKRD